MKTDRDLGRVLDGATATARPFRRPSSLRRSGRCGNPAACRFRSGARRRLFDRGAHTANARDLLRHRLEHAHRHAAVARAGRAACDPRHRCCRRGTTSTIRRASTGSWPSFAGRGPRASSTKGRRRRRPARCSALGRNGRAALAAAAITLAACALSGGMILGRATSDLLFYACAFGQSALAALGARLVMRHGGSVFAILVLGATLLRSPSSSKPRRCRATSIVTSGTVG